MDTTRDLQMPSGSEVESATLHPPIYAVGATSVTLPERSGMRGKLDTLKSRGLSKVHDIQRVVSDRSTAMTTTVKSSVMTARGSMRDGAKTHVTKVQDSMKNQPMMWAGIAAGSGFVLGMIGRIAHWRSKHQMTPTLVIIESGC
jgi:ElaB/YqjD/DUF883 family membrane-anchored ribosome-binding protein